MEDTGKILFQKKSYLPYLSYSIIALVFITIVDYFILQIVNFDILTLVIISIVYIILLISFVSLISTSKFIIFEKGLFIPHTLRTIHIDQIEKINIIDKKSKFKGKQPYVLYIKLKNNSEHNHIDYIGDIETYQELKKFKERFMERKS